MVILLVYFFRSKILFLGLFGPRIQKSKFKTKFGTYNQFHNILRILDILPNFPFTTSETIITYKHGAYELPHELPNDLRLRILGN